MLPRFKAAACHVAPIFLDKEATTDKAISLIREAARTGAELIVFPESYIPAFPIWSALWAPIDNHDLFFRMAENSVAVPGREIARIQAEAKNLDVFVSLGISERSPVSLGALWNTNLMISNRGEILTHHRKIVPTFYEKMVWANGDGAGLAVCDTRLGRIGALICGENTNPLARYAMMAQGEQVHICTWPAIWPTRRPAGGGNFNNLMANRTRSSAHSFEAKAFGINCAGFLDGKTRDYLVARDPQIADVVDHSPQAETFVIDPTGTQIGDPLRESEGILYADIDIAACVEPKQFHDVVGYYNRFDIFDLTVVRHRQQAAQFVDDGAAESIRAGDETGTPDMMGPALGEAVA